MNLLLDHTGQGDHSFSTMIFHDFSMTKNEFPRPIGTTYFYRNKRYTIYKCLPE